MSNPRQVQQFHVLEFAFLLPAVVLILFLLRFLPLLLLLLLPRYCCYCCGCCFYTTGAKFGGPVRSWTRNSWFNYFNSLISYIRYIQPGNPALPRGAHDVVGQWGPTPRQGLWRGAAGCLRALVGSGGCHDLPGRCPRPRRSENDCFVTWWWRYCMRRVMIVIVSVMITILGITGTGILLSKFLQDKSIKNE